MPEFVKSLAQAERLQAEADALEAIRATNTVRVPGFIDLEIKSGISHLRLEYLELRPLQRSAAIALGESLAALHGYTQAEYGWQQDNFIGSMPQFNSPLSSWPLFYAQRRLLPQLKWAVSNGLGKQAYEQGIFLTENCEVFFSGSSHPQPSLLHGDLWAGNAGQLNETTPVIFDPASYYGDRAADIAMSELFGGFPEVFYTSYRHAWPLPPEYSLRRQLYNLYHVLNHFNLFGSSYLGQAKRLLAELSSELKG